MARARRISVPASLIRSRASRPMSSRSRTAHRRQGARYQRSRRHPRPDRHRSHLGVRLCPGTVPYRGQVLNELLPGGSNRSPTLCRRTSYRFQMQMSRSERSATPCWSRSSCEADPARPRPRQTHYDAGARTIYGLTSPMGCRRTTHCPRRSSPHNQSRTGRPRRTDHRTRDRRTWHRRRRAVGSDAHCCA